MSIYSHGPSAREQEVLNLWENGHAPEEIASALDMRVSYVRRVVAMLSAPKADDWHSAARVGSDALLKAIRRHHPERCGGAL